MKFLVQLPKSPRWRRGKRRAELTAWRLKCGIPVPLTRYRAYEPGLAHQALGDNRARRELRSQLARDARKKAGAK